MRRQREKLLFVRLTRRRPALRCGDQLALLWRQLELTLASLQCTLRLRLELIDNRVG